MRAVSANRAKRRRTKSGASVILICFLAVGLGIVAYFAFQYYLLMGGSSELRNAVDAGAINVSKRVFQLRVPAKGEFSDCADTSGRIGLSNVNRVWGKAYLINANMEEMQRDGLAKPEAGSNADMAYQQAQNINDMIAGKLKSKHLLDKYFNQVANSRQASMLGADATVNTEENGMWATAMVDRGAESNLKVSQPQLPKGARLNRVKGAAAGYTPVTANNKVFCFVPFKQGEMPHLISDFYFDKNRGDTNPVPNAPNPLPNAFKESGAVNTTNVALSAAASAVANPGQTYDLAMPHCFVSLIFTNRARWFVEKKQITDTEYGTVPEVQWGVKRIPLGPPCGGKLDGYGKLGNEYTRGSIWAVINSIPGDHTPALAPMLQRIREIDPRYSMNKLVALLRNAPFQPGASRYFIYPEYRTQDLTDPQIKIAPDTGGLPPWLNPNTLLDGMETNVFQEPVSVDDPNSNFQVITEGKYSNGKHEARNSGSIKWTPGTGFGGCLGSLRLARQTDLYFSGDQ